MVFSYRGDRGTTYCLRTDRQTAKRRTKGYRISSTGLWPVELKIDEDMFKAKEPFYIITDIRNAVKIK